MSRNKRHKTNHSSTPEISRLYPRTESQGFLMDSIEQYPITIAAGAAGVGKTLIALHSAVWMLNNRGIDKILYLKPNVDFSGERGLGFLPGDLDEKIAPLLYPVLDNLEVFVTPGKRNYLLDKKQIECFLLEYLRGRSLRNTFVIFDEAQNTTKNGILTAISRLEDTSKLVICGDPTQQDTETRDNGLADALKRLQGLEQVGIVKFNSDDIVRNSFLRNVIERFEAYY